MTALEFLAAIIDSLAWPLAVVALAFVFRRQLADLVTSLKQLKYKDFEATFESELRKVESRVPTPSRATTAQALQVPPAVVQLADVSPRAAILDAWLSLEAKATEAVKARKPEEYGRRFTLGPRLLAQELRDTDVLDAEKTELFKSLARLRNLAVHGPGFAISSDQAIGFARMAQSLGDEIAD